MEESIDIQVETVRETGDARHADPRLHESWAKMRGLPPRHTVQGPQQILDDSLRLVRQYHQRGAGAQIQIALAPCSPFSVTEEIVVESAKLAAELDVRLHTPSGGDAG